MSAKNVRLLVLDETAQYSHDIEECARLTYTGYRLEVRYADSEQCANELSKHWEPSVVIVDAYLPKNDSFTLLESYRAKQVPVIMASATLSHDIENSARARGASAYVEKSESFDDLEGLLTLLDDVSDDVQTVQ